MTLEARTAPPNFQGQYNSKCTKYRADIARLKKDLVSLCLLASSYESRVGREKVRERVSP
jgi:hypothetical protein